MIGLIVIAAALGFVLWRFAHSPVATFQNEFATLLAWPAVTRTRLASLFSGSQHLAGAYRNRVVMVVLQRPTEDDRGFVAVSMAAKAPFRGGIRKESRWTVLGKRLDLVYDEEIGDAELDRQYVFSTDDSRALKTWIANSDVRRTVDALLQEHDLSVEVDRSWLKATWLPPRFAVFPGRFDAQKWTAVLSSMHLLADSLERPPAPPDGPS